MSHESAAVQRPVAVGVVGAGRIGSSHATLLARHVPGARLVGVADARPAVADALAQRLGCRAFPDPAALIGDPDIEAVVIAATTEAHAELVEQVAASGKGVFCEKPAGLTLAEVDRGIAATDAAGVAFQVGFNRRFARDFAAGHDVVRSGGVGTPQLMRSLTRDPGRPGGGLADPGGVPPWTIFRLTLIHDFDTLLWLNPGAQPVTVHATADALIAPDFKDAGLLDTAVVVITFDNGALAVAEASFSAAYGYDVRSEVFGSAGMVTMGEGARSSLRHHTETGRHADTARSDVELLRDSYVGELDEFVAAVREGRAPSVTGRDARRALTLALASIRSVETGSTVRVADLADVAGVAGVGQ
jgi:myo-inositol 2-dehydrogenase/D-chiro-inositol 1-dehydrogenase